MPGFRDANRRTSSELKGKPLVLSMDRLAEAFAKAAFWEVKIALERELRDAGAKAWNDEARLALANLLEDPKLLTTEPADESSNLLSELAEGIECPRPADDEDVREHADLTGRVMASAWVQFLALALRQTAQLDLHDTLLPDMNAATDSLWRAWRDSLNALVIGGDEAPRILKRFAGECIAEHLAVDLPLGVTVRRSVHITQVQNSPFPYFATSTTMPLA